MQRRVRTSPKYGRAFADWLDRKLEAVRIARADPRLSDSKIADLIGISHAMVSRFRAAQSLPSRATTRGLVIGLNAQRVPATVAEIEQLVVESDPGRGDPTRVFLHDPNGSDTVPALGGIQNVEESPAPPVRRPAVILYGPHGQVDGQEELTDEEVAGIAASIAGFRARRASQRGSGDAGRGRAGAGGSR